MDSGNYLGFRSYGGEVELHRHNFHQLVLPHRGALDLDVEGKGGRVTAGRGVLIPAGADHAFSARGTNGFIVVDVLSDGLNESVVDRLGRSAFFDIHPSVQSLLAYLQTMFCSGEAPEHIGRHWCALLFDALGATPDDRPRPARIAAENALSFMRDNLARPLSVPAIASAAGVSQTRLLDLFHQVYGRTPHALLIDLRLDAAEALLRDTDFSIAEIAVRSGHCDQSSLTRRLGQSRGLTPAAYRRQQRDITAT